MRLPRLALHLRPRSGQRLLPLSICAALLAACAAPADSGTGATNTVRFTQPVVLLGEVHDNAAQHALRLQAFADWLASGARPTLALEQLDADRQPAIDAARAAKPALTADALIAAAVPSPAGSGWNWDHYRPFIALALQHGLPVVAVNLPRSQARDVMRDGLAANHFDANVPPALLRTQAAAIEASHCGMVDAATAGRMALAQVARDQLMARIVSANQTGGVLLLAGNGHVRTDIGVPHWLDPATRSRSQAIGVVEPGDPLAAFDSRVVTAAQARPDPCAGMRAAPAQDSGQPATAEPSTAAAPTPGPTATPKPAASR